MNVALLTDGIHPYIIGGMQKHSYCLAKYFAANHIYIDLYHPNINKTESEFLDAFTAEEQKYIRPIFVEFPKTPYFPGHYLYRSYLYSKNIFSKYQQLEVVDFIYAQGFTGWAFLKNKNKKVPLSVHFHGLNMFQQSFGTTNWLNNLIFKPFAKYNIENADVVFSLGRNLTQLMLKNTSVKKVVEIPIGIEEFWLNEKPKKNHEVLRFVFVGRYDKVKGIDLLNEAIENLIADKIRFQFDFVGPFPLDKQLKHEQLRYHGEIKDSYELKKIMETNDVIVLCSYSEGMPTVIVEAMACGLAVLSTDVGVVDELVDDGNGILITPGNAVAVEEGIKKIIAMSSEELCALKLKSIEKVKTRFLWKHIISKTIEEIHEILPK